MLIERFSISLCSPGMVLHVSVREKERSIYVLGFGTLITLIICFSTLNKLKVEAGIFNDLVSCLYWDYKFNLFG